MNYPNYITTKFLGQESGFKHFGCVKRNLAFENLPMELWHKKELPSISSTDFAVNWHNSVKSDNYKSLESKTDVGNISQGYKVHGQLKNPIKKSHSLQPTKTDFKRPHHPLKNLSPRGPEESGESASDLAEAVEKVLEQSAQTSRDEINVAEVVKRVLGEINTSGDQREEANPEESRYRLPKDEVKKELKQGQSYFENIAKVFHQSPETSASREKKYDQNFDPQKSPDQLIDGETMYSPLSHKDSHTSSENMIAKANLQCISEIHKPHRNQKDETPAKAKCAKSKTNENLKDVDNDPALFTAEKQKSCLPKDQKGNIASIRLKCDLPPMKAKLKPLAEPSPKQALFRQKSSLVDIYEKGKVKKELKQGQSKGMSYFEKIANIFHHSPKPTASSEKKYDQDFYPQKTPDQHTDGKKMYSRMSHKDDHATSENMLAKANLQCISKMLKPNRNQKNATPAKAKCSKSNTNENLKEGVENDPTLFTAEKQESRLPKEQTGSIINIRLKHDPPPIKAELKPLAEQTPKQALFRQKSSLVNIYEEENITSNVNLLFESSPQKSESENPVILVTGGMDHNNLHTTGMGVSMLNYDPKQDKWTRYGTLPSPRHNHAAVLWDNCLYIIGGCNPHETLQQKRYVAKRSCYKLDITTSQWSELQDMKFPRYDHGVAVLDGQIYAIGGQDIGDRLLKTMEVYDTKKDQWKVLPSELCCGRKAMGTAILDGKIWIAGGLIQADKEVTQHVISHVDCYDPKQKRWTFNLCALPSPRCYCSLAIWNDRIYCIGGLLIESTEKMLPTKEVWILNDREQTWEEGPSLPVPRMSCATLVYDGLLYVIGGFDPESDVAIRNVNYLSPAAISWEDAEPLPSHLFGIAVICVPNMD